jgi:4-amino-4-deoxy-L-arabinose transferase-like glycosyltransferase
LCFSRKEGEAGDIIARVTVANKARVMALLCCLIAFLLSAWTLDARSLWGDEAFSVWASKQDAIKLIAGLDAQPPLYHLALGAGRALFGESVFAIRFLSVMAGVLLVAVGANMGRRIGGVYVSILTALLLATSPILLYFMQEARMYTLAALMAGGAMLLAVVMLQRSRDEQRLAIGDWLTYVALTLAALFTHFYTAGVLLANSIALGIAALRSRNVRRMAEWVIAHAAIAAIFLGWFIGLQSRYAVQSAQSRPRIVPLPEDIINNIGRGINGVIFGMRADAGTTIFALALFVLALAGLLGYWRRGKRGVALLIAGTIGFSMLLVLLTAAPSGLVSDFNPRYFLFTLLPLALAAGGWSLWKFERGDLSLNDARDVQSEIENPKSKIHNLSSPISAVVAFVALIPALVGISQLLDTSWQKSRYDELIDAIQQRSRPGDGIVMVNSDQFVLMDYYGSGILPALNVPNGELSSAPAKVTETVQQFAQDKARVWLINFGWAMNLQGRSAVEEALAGKGARTYAQGFQDAALALYDLRATGGDAPIQPKNVRFGEQILLAGVRERSTRFQAGDAITLDLFWQALQKPQADYTVFMHLRKAGDGAQIAAFDGPPANGAAPTSSWSVGQTITDTRAIAIPQDAKAGEYDVVIGLYQYPSFERLKIDGGDSTEIAVSRVTISP